MILEIGKTYYLRPPRLIIKLIEYVPSVDEFIVENRSGKRIGYRRRESRSYIEHVAIAEITEDFGCLGA